MIDFSKLKNCVKIENFFTCSKRFTKNKSTKIQVNLGFTNVEEIIYKVAYISNWNKIVNKLKDLTMSRLTPVTNVSVKK